MLLSSHRAEQEDTPLTLRSPPGCGSFNLSPGPPRVPAEPPAARLRQRAHKGRKNRVPRGPAWTSAAGKVSAAGRQPRGGVRAASPGSPGGPRDSQAAVSPWTARRASGSGSGAGRTSLALVARGSAPLPRVRWLPAAPPIPGTTREGPPGFRPPGQRPQSPASSTSDGQGAGADSPAAPSGVAPRELVQSPAPPAAHRLPALRPQPRARPPACLHQAAPARARSSPATRPGP